MLMVSISSDIIVGHFVVFVLSTSMAERISKYLGKIATNSRKQPVSRHYYPILWLLFIIILPLFMNCYLNFVQSFVAMICVRCGLVHEQVNFTQSLGARCCTFAADHSVDMSTFIHRFFCWGGGTCGREKKARACLSRNYRSFKRDVRRLKIRENEQHMNNICLASII